MNEFIYSVNAIFSVDKTSGCLGFNNTEYYYIAPYQRGYKWASDTRFDEVPQLLVDLYDAYSNKIKEYFLQYITVKRIKLEERVPYVLEVIDGQQRLTTLNLLFQRIEEAKLGVNIYKHRLVYSRYGNEDIFDAVNQRIQEDASLDDKIEKQDLFYMVKAGRCIDSFLNVLKGEGVNINEFIEYIGNSVKIILNRENAFVESEEIFANLNDNKVPLTNAYLIKGLLLTKAARRSSEFGKAYNYKDIVDQRTIMGRTWDEISSWFEQERVSYYFFRTRSGGMEKMLGLVNIRDADRNEIIDIYIKNLKSQNKKDITTYELFNRFNESVTTTSDAIRILGEIKHIYRKFRSIYGNMEDSRLCNLLGYRLFSNSTPFDLCRIVRLSAQELKGELIKEILPVIPDPDKEEQDLGYKGKHQKLTNLLLAFSVFPENSNKHYRFDFYQYDAVEKWSFEHISPQNPKEDVCIDPGSRDWVADAIRKDEGLSQDTKDMLMEKIGKGEKIPVRDIEFLYGGDIEGIDSLGNMALLSGGVNSALSNNPFIAKRRILFQKINSGSFVPKHTIDVFSKILASDSGKSFTPDFVKWGQDDVDAHVAWMKARYKSILNHLKNEQE